MLLHTSSPNSCNLNILSIPIKIQVKYHTVLWPLIVESKDHQLNPPPLFLDAYSKHISSNKISFLVHTPNFFF